MDTLRKTWPVVKDYFFIFIGGFAQALAIRLFLVPGDLVSGGVSGISQLINYYTGWPIGLLIFLGNVPLFLLGWRFLGGKGFAARTAFAVLVISFFTDFLGRFLPESGLTDDMILNTLYGGLLSGVGYGLVYLGRSTSGGSDILARILVHWRNLPYSQSYLITDALVILGAGVTFGWENALYALVLLYASGIVAEAVLQGPNVVRTAIIISAQSQALVERVLKEMERGVTVMEGKGGYSGGERGVLICVISRSEVVQLKALVHEVDPLAFMVIGQAHEALGEGFRPWVRT